MLLSPQQLFNKLKELDWYCQFPQGEEITTCPYCSSRTEILLDLSHTTEETQIHICRRSNCTFIFYSCKDDFEYEDDNEDV